MTGYGYSVYADDGHADELAAEMDRRAGQARADALAAAAPLGPAFTPVPSGTLEWEQR